MDMKLPTTTAAAAAAAHRGAAVASMAPSSGAKSSSSSLRAKGGQLASMLVRPKRLALSLASLCLVCWVLAGDVMWQLANQVAQRASPHLRTPAPTPKHCVKMNMGHIEGEFYREDNCLSRADMQRIIKDLVWTVADVFEKHEIPYWLDSGTLLGSVREKTVIPHDVDADIGISEKSFIQLRDHEIEFPPEYDFQVHQSKIHRQGTRVVELPGRLAHKGSGLYLDIFVFMDNEKDAKMFGPVPSICFSDCHRCPRLGGRVREFTIPRDWVYPLQSCPFGERNVSCPANPELYLDHLYGPKFMTPH